MAWASAILGLLQALPELLNLGKQFMAWLNQVSGNDPKGFVKKIGQAVSELNDAKTPEERKNAAKSIADVISRLP